METYNNILVVWLGISIIVFITLFFKSAPYGRHSVSSWGPSMSSRLGWILMESPTVYLMILFMILFNSSLGVVEAVFILIWMVHYVHRSFIWPLRAKLEGKTMSVVIALLAILFNFVNVIFKDHGYLYLEVIQLNGFGLRFLSLVFRYFA